MVVIQKMEHHKFIEENEISVDPTVTDIWFNVIDPQSGRLLSRDHPSVVP